MVRTQVILSIQLPFAVVPVVYFTGSKQVRAQTRLSAPCPQRAILKPLAVVLAGRQVMGPEFVNGPVTKVSGGRGIADQAPRLIAQLPSSPRLLPPLLLLQFFGWLAAVVFVGLNGWLLIQVMAEAAGVDLGGGRR